MRAFEGVLDELLRSLRVRDASVELRDLAFRQITPASTSPAHGDPGPLVRVFGRAVNSAVTRFPWSWRLFSGPVRTFVDSVADGWDERVRSDLPGARRPLLTVASAFGPAPCTVVVASRRVPNSAGPFSPRSAITSW